MKKISIITVLFIFYLTQTGFAKEANKSENKPELKIIESTYAFKSITEGIEIIHDFALKNVGKSPLDIKKVKPG